MTEGGESRGKRGKGEEREITVLVVSFSYVQILKSKNVKMLLSPSAVNQWVITLSFPWKWERSCKYTRIALMWLHYKVKDMFVYVINVPIVNWIHIKDYLGGPDFIRLTFERGQKNLQKLETKSERLIPVVVILWTAAIKTVYVCVRARIGIYVYITCFCVKDYRIWPRANKDVLNLLQYWDY